MSEIELSDAVGRLALEVTLIVLLLAAVDFWRIFRPVKKKRCRCRCRCPRCGWVNTPGLIACEQCRRELVARSKI